jgi:hypothetical protein
MERNNFVKLQMKRKIYKGRGSNNRGTKPMGWQKGGNSKVLLLLYYSRYRS